MVWWWWGCFGGSEPVEESTPEEQAALAQIVAAHTDGLVSRTTEPRVRFVNPVLGALPQAMAPTGALVLEPAVDGVARWTDGQELVFVPAAPLAAGTTYKVTLDLAKIGFGADQAPFHFEFSTLAQAYELDDRGLEMDDAGATRFRGRIQTTDTAESAEIEKMLTARQGKKALKVSWTHEGGNQHEYVVEGIAREDARSVLALIWDGSPIGVDASRTVEVNVPAKSEFGLMSWRAQTGEQQYVELRFTDPLSAKQNLAGLITAEGYDDLRFEADGNIVRVYGTRPWVGTVTLQIEGLKNRAGTKLPSPATAIVSFDPIKPAVRFASTGTVLPTTQGLTVPIEAVNVRAVEIEATRVYESNVPQFLQVNDLDGDKEIKRVGQVIWRQRVPIEVGPEDQNRWVRLGLDVSKLVAEHPTGLYHLRVRFDRPDVVYDCSSAPPAPRPVAAVGPEPWDGPVRDKSFWDFWGDDAEGEDSWYERYQQRHDPCSMSYYAEYDDHDVEVTKNVLVSNVGVIAKRGEDDDLLVVVNDLRSTAPTAGAQIRVLDYQLQTVATGQTGADGIVRMEVPGHPFVIEATVGAEHGYVKLDRAGALAIGHFDTGGMVVADGLKGYLYGERGVWRPGDDIFLNFVLQDETGKLPKDHPLQFELRNPLGVVVERKTVRSGVGGFYDLRTRTAADAPTGPYTATVDLGGRKFTETLRVESIQPNRLKIAFELPPEGVRAPDLHLRTELASRWLHGAPAPNLRAQIDGKLVPRKTSFPKLDGYVFDDPTRRWSAEPFTLFEGYTDDQGDTTVDVPVEIADGAPGFLTLELSTRVFEPSGAFSIDQAQVPVSPHARYVGIKLPKGDASRNMLLTDTRHTVEVVTVDADGKLTGGSPLRWALYEVNWRWWWEKGEENLADYAGSTSHRAVAEGVVDTANGKGSLQFEVKYPDWGRYLLLVTDEDGTHRAGTTMYIDWPGWAGRASKDNPGGASVLSVTADKTEVETGQPVTITFPTPSGGGRALLSLETGTEVLRTAWIEPTGETTSTTIVATPDMAPSAYVHVTLLQPHEATKNDLPIRLYGVLPLSVVDKATKLEPTLVTTDEWRPEGQVNVAVREAAGRPMTYTLAVVDEGLLGLTRFATPDPWSAFYGREALGVRTWDIYDTVAGAYGAALEGMIAIGGDGEAQPGAQPQAKRFPPMVIHLGTHQLAAGETKTHELSLPPYIGEVRVMAIAGDGHAFGSAEKSVKVKKPLMVMASLPRVLGPGEELTIPVDVFALEPKVKDVTVNLQVEGPVTLMGPARQELHFGGIGDQMAEFRVQVQDALGIARFTVEAKGGGETASHTVEMAVRHPGVRQTDVLAAVVEAGQTWKAAVALPGMPGTNEAELEVSRVPPLNLGARLESLIHYPHGCVEQTTSGAFPQLMLSSVTELTPEQKQRIQKNVAGGIERLKQFQTSEGGYGYWPGDRTADEWATSYVGHFLLEAERTGHLLSPGSKRAWIAYQKQASARWSRRDTSSDLQQAYRLYTLALAGQPDLGGMNRLKDVPMSAAARFRLASAYQLAGHPETAKKLAEGKLEVEAYRELTGTYGSSVRDQALILETLVLLGDSRALPMAKTISDALSQDRWMSTQETAMALVAMSRFAGSGGVADKLSFTWSVAGDARTVDAAKALALMAVPVGDRQELPLTLQNTSSGPLFVRAITHGLPKVGEESASESGLSIDVTYTTLAGTQVDPARVGHGTDLVAHVVVKNETKGKLSELALTQGVPSGWELFGNASGRGSDYDHRDVRDDRVFTYFDLEAGQAREFTIKANAGYRGRFYLPPASVEAMYDATISARSTGQWVTVTNPAEG
jgi:uncharacterized protein YfaS (alpha-2-macroglobulin family)